MKPYIIVQSGEEVRLTLGNGTTTISAEMALSMAMELLDAGRAAVNVESKRKAAELAALVKAYEVTP